MKVVEWKCHVCLKETPERSVSVCSRCILMSCPEHSLTVKDKETESRLTVCSQCIKEGDDIQDIFFKVKRACKIPFKKED